MFPALVLILWAYVADSTSLALATPSHGVDIETSHNQFHEGLTNQLIINCTFTHVQGSNLSTTLSLILSKTASANDSTYREVASITAFSNDKVDEKDTMGAQVTGHHRVDAYSFIALENQCSIMSSFELDIFYRVVRTVQ
ncbi:uncharacterized protein LOC101863007 [Aplysia californica]|uniref:Uncharacterized protein LOC101863007 n=1 Tax=Aplysia californica TaxID=6500 RepID=A0ABM0ZVL6_APLCA|nr:uncharacterized protein LOC101863007 [Aplysia californica]